jgi:hypothetical protein
MMLMDFLHHMYGGGAGGGIGFGPGGWGFGDGNGTIDMSSGWSSLDRMPNPGAAYGITRNYPWDADAITYFR